MDERLAAISERQGVFTRPDALTLGYDDRGIDHQVRGGTWHRVRRGAFLPGETWATLDPRERHRRLTRAVLLNARSHAVVSHISALMEYDAPSWGIPLDQVHLTRFDGRSGRVSADVRQHSGLLTADDVTVRNGLLITSPTRTVLDMMRLVDREHGLAVADDLVRKGETSRELLLWRNQSMTHWPDSLGVSVTLALVDGRAESVGETRSRHLCWCQGLPAPIPQYEIRHRGLLVARLDLAWPQRKVWLEFDGRVKYVAYLRPGETAADAVMREKRREDEIRRITGWRCLRIVWADLDRPAWVAAELRRLFAEQAAA